MRYTNLDTIRYQLDNDFGIDNSDWIPRIGEWVRAAMADLKIENEIELVTRKVFVNERIVKFPCDFDKLVGMYSSMGCLITKFNPLSHIRNKRYFYIAEYRDITVIKRTKVIDENGNIISKSLEYVPGYKDDNIGCCPNLHYIPISSDAVELTNDDKYVWLTYTSAASDINGNILVPDVQNILEAIKWYCFWKILGRGTKHITYSLTGRNENNPQWLYENRYKAKAQKAYRDEFTNNEEFSQLVEGLWNSSFYLTMYKHL